MSKSPLFSKDILDNESNEGTLRSHEPRPSGEHHHQRHSLGGYDRGLNSKSELKGGVSEFKNRINHIFGGLGL